MSVDLSGEITAIATAVLAAFAIVTAAFAFLAYRTQAQEVGILLEQNERDVAERRRDQAAQVFIGASSNPLELEIFTKNASDLPIFDTQEWYASLPIGRLSEPIDLGAIMPHERAAMSPRIFPINEEPTVSFLTFRDAAGVRWIRMADGILKEQTRPTTRESLLEVLRPLWGVSAGES